MGSSYVPTQPPEITRLLTAWSNGDASALSELMPLVHDELRRLAQRQLAREYSGRATETAEIVNEAYLRLIDCRRVRWQDRAHFFAMAAQLMRRVLVDDARARQAEKRGGGSVKVTFSEDLGAAAPDWIAVHEALEALEALDARKGRMVELRYFGGLSVDETALVLAVSPETIHRDWKFARSWLRRELSTGANA